MSITWPRLTFVGIIDQKMHAVIQYDADCRAISLRQLNFSSFDVACAQAQCDSVAFTLRKVNAAALFYGLVRNNMHI